MFSVIFGFTVIGLGVYAYYLGISLFVYSTEDLDESLQA